MASLHLLQLTLPCTKKCTWTGIRGSGQNMHEWLSDGNLMFRLKEMIPIKLPVVDGQPTHRFVASEPDDVDINHHVVI